MISKLTRQFTPFELMTIALMASLGIALKPVIVPLVHVITGPLYIPGGAVAGGLYMSFLVLAASLTGKLGAATLTGVVQAVLMLVTGIFGTHGAMSLFTYILPALAIDLVLLLMRHRAGCLLCCFLAGTAANLVGTVSVNFVFFRMPWLPLVLTITVAILSGGIGGIIAFLLTKQLQRVRVIKSKPDRP